MSSPPPRQAPPGRTVQPVAMDAGRYATQGMIAPSDILVNGDGTPTGVTFRFLHSLFQQINQIEQRLTNAGIP